MDWHWETIRRAVGAVAGTSAALLASTAIAQNPNPKALAYGAHLAQECTACHRRDGVDNGIVSIIGMKAEVFMETFKYYQTGARTNQVMVSVAQSLDDAQIEALAAFYASLSPVGKTVTPR